jgi:uncharacterized protein (DUF58 family)
MQDSLKTLDYLWLLPSGPTATLGRLEFLARRPKEGYVSGRHTSPYKGASVEFEEHRAYTFGDDIRDLDWRVYGKKDRYYIKQYMEETNLRATVILDVSGSMTYTGELAAEQDGQRLSKFRYGQYLAAAVTHLLMRQQDAVGLVTFDTDVRTYIPARSRSTQLRLILEELHRTTAGGETSAGDVLHAVAERVHRRGLVVVISDLFDDAERIIRALHHFHYRGHELVVFHVMAEEELTFPFEKFHIFRNLEDEHMRLQVDPHTVRALYLERVRQFVTRLEKGCGQLRADYVPMTTKMPFDRALSSYLARRQYAK